MPRTTREHPIAGIDVHKKMLAVVVADVEVDGDFHFDRQKVGTTPADLRGLANWLIEQEALEREWFWMQRPVRREHVGPDRAAGP